MTHYVPLDFGSIFVNFLLLECLFLPIKCQIPQIRKKMEASRWEANESHGSKYSLLYIFVYYPLGESQ